MAEVSIRERVKRPPAPAMIESYYGPALERAVRTQFDLEIWVHLAHAAMLARQDIIAAADAQTLRRALLALHAAGPDALGADGTAEDLYSYIERHLTRTLGPEVGGRLHTGRSRNDLHVTTWRMALRALLAEVLTALNALRRVALAQARRYAETVMPGYTHWQHAQPVTLGYYLLAFADLLARDFARLRAAYARVDCCPLGAGALATTAFPLDRAFTAAALGFGSVMEVAYDAVSSRDDAQEAVAACAVLTTGLSRLAVDLQAWSTYEYRFVELADQHCAVSSIMPQKKNPAALEHIKATAAMVTGALTAVLAASKNTAFADVSDGVTAGNEPALDAALRTRRILALAADVLGAITVFPERMADFAATGYGTATELADVIVRETGLSFRMAHNIVVVVVAEAIAASRAANEIAAAELEAAAERLFGRRLGLSAEVVRAALDPAENVRRRTVTGGPAPANMTAMLAARDAALAAETAEVAALAAHLAARRAAVFETG
jgi:argininosuccinate lyase